MVKVSIIIIGNIQFVEYNFIYWSLYSMEYHCILCMCNWWNMNFQIILLSLLYRGDSADWQCDPTD